MILEKKCKGQSVAISFSGCGLLTRVELRKYGLCQKCLRDFYLNTDAGKEKIQRSIIKAKELTPKIERQKTAKEIKEFNNSNPSYLKKKIQDGINKIVRMIDFGQPCLATRIGSCMNDGKRWDAGHVASRGSNTTIAFNLHNIHRQKASSNKWQSHDHKMWLGLKNFFSQEYHDFVESLSLTPIKKFTAPELLVFKLKVDIIVLELSKQEYKIRSPQELIQMRNEINERIGIYDSKFCTFKNN